MVFTRRQIETALTAMVAAITGIAGLAARGDQPVFGPKYLALERIGTFAQPVHVTQAPGSELLAVVERAGRIRLLGDDQRVRTLLDIRRQVKANGVGGEQGLLSVAFAPDYRSSGRLYVAFTDRRRALRVVEYRHPPESELKVPRSSARNVIKIPQPTAKHHGGLLLFGPQGLLYIGSGDGGPSGDPANVSQSRRSLLGKILRINPRKHGRSPYTIPKDNPFVGRQGRDEIYAYGLRNPWRFAFDRATGAFAVGDVGNDRYEELDYVRSDAKLSGANFGWAAFEGGARFKGRLARRRTVEPTVVYAHGPGCSITGGPFVRDPRLSRIPGRAVIGSHLYGDYCSGRIFAVRQRPGKTARKNRLHMRVRFLTSFGEDRSGRIYIASQRGPVYRIDPRRKQLG